MVTRIAASLLALIVLATSGMLGGAKYLCSMDGQVRSECCCEEAQAEANHDCAQVVRADGCCEVRITKADHQPARVEGTRHQLQPVPILATLSVVSRVQSPATQDANLPLGARGPPDGSSPLFSWNCSYLI